MAKVLTRVKIEKIGYGGIGLARMSDGKRILIKWGALPGSIVDLRIVKQKKDYIEAHITHIHELDPKIVDGKVFCPHFFSLLSSNDPNTLPWKIGCGGCKRQMLSYGNQLKLKEDIVSDSFTKIKRQLPDLQILSIIWSPDEKRYRNKIEFSFGKYITTIPEDKQKITEDAPPIKTEEQEKINKITHDIIWVSMDIHNQLWNWLREEIYKRALKKWLEKKWHTITLEYKVDIVFDGDTIGKWYIDVLVDNLVIVELKVIGYIDKKQFQQLRTYLQAAKQPTGLIIDFWGKSLQYKRLEKDNFNYQKWNLLESKKNLLVSSDRSVGFHKQWEFSKIIDIDDCSLISEEANVLFQHIKTRCKESGLPVYDQMTHQGFFRHLVLRQGTNTGQFLVNLSVSNNNLKETSAKKRDDFLDLIKKDPLLNEKINSFVITYNNGLADIIRSQDCETKIFRGEGYIYEKLTFRTETSDKKSEISEEQSSATSSTPSSGISNNHLKSSVVSFRVSPFSFFQTNTLWAQQLFAQAMKMVGHIEGTILDLYCGTGSIGISFLKSGKWDRLVGIEIVEESITDARHNAKINGIESQAIFLAAPAEKAFIQTPEIKNKLNNLGLVIIDPPRDGLHKNVVQMICDLKKESDFKLLYISCNPVTMGRDIELLVKGGFSIKEIQPMDMFPQTHHIECIGILV